MNTKCLLVSLIILFGFLCKGSLSTNIGFCIICYICSFDQKRKKNGAVDTCKCMERCQVGRLLLDSSFSVPLVLKGSKIR